MLNVDLNTIREALAATSHGNKEAVYQRYAKRLGVSKATIQRSLRKEYGCHKKVKREKRIPQYLIDRIAKIKVEGLLLTKGAQKQRELSTEKCIDMLIDMEVPDTDLLYIIDEKTGEIQYKTGTINRRLAESGFRERDVKQRIEAPYANYQWQMDFSRSKYFQMKGYDPEKDDFMLKVHGRELHYKADDAKLRTWVVQVIDEFSRIRDVQFYAASGESWLIGLDMLHRMFNRNGKSEHPLRFVPERLKTDNGAFIKKKEVKAGLKAAGIIAKQSRPGNSDSQGKVESGFRSLWIGFELELATRLKAGTTIYLSELNDLVEEFCLNEMKLEHPAYLDTRGAVYYQSIQARAQKVIEEDIKTHAFKIETRKVNDCLLFSWGGQGRQYQAPQWAAGKRVRVYQNLNGDVLVESIDEFKRIGHAIPPKEGEKYPYKMLDDFEHRPHNNYRQDIETEVEKTARERKGEPFREGKRVFMPPLERKQDFESPFTERKIENEFRNINEARVWVGTQIYNMTGGTYADFDYVFDEILDETLDKDVIKQKVEDLRIVLIKENMNLAK